MNTNAKSNRNFKTCPMCSNEVNQDEYQNHLDDCGIELSSSPKTKTTKKKKCQTCLLEIDVTIYVDHISDCSGPNTTKICPNCSKTIEEKKYLDHFNDCTNVPPKPKPLKMKLCQNCNENIPQNEYADHMEVCVEPPRSEKLKIKKCQNCNQNIPQNEYADHMEVCVEPPRPEKLKIKKCQNCNQNIPERDYLDHFEQCENTKPDPNPTEECPLCSKQFPINDLTEHASRCNGPSVTSKSMPPVAKTSDKTCTACSKPIFKPSGFDVECQHKHVYCNQCLEQSMNQHLESNTPPVCNSKSCDYELSRYDIYRTALKNDLISRLLPLVKSMRRPKCPLCLFYVDMKTMDDFYRHANSCINDQIPCEYCHCLFNMDEINNHTRLCRQNEPSDRLQAYQNFILSRTKYPMTIHELRVFIEERKKDRLSTGIHDIVDELAKFDGVFPYDIPTRDCDICMNPFVYDDIFVFGCDENHKACYECFAESTETKMKNNEILTCVMCNYLLHDGEIKQLKIPVERRRQYIDYQANKTFSNFTGGQGILRCPSKDCKWVAQLTDPNDRFKVICGACRHEFCSLCSQQYHYRTTCQQLPDLTQRWFFWCNTERGNYWQARAQQDASYRAQLEDYQRQRVANEQRNDELRRRYDELLADEQYKAQNCRLCPNCRRVVQKLDGCDSMICGQNYHGGDQQSGCGHKFNWARATPYVPMENRGPQQVANNIAAPEQQKLVVHTGIQCDACHTEVQGIRFDCVHCPSLIFCEKCEQRASLKHSEDIRAQNKPQHIFQVIPTAENANV